MGKTHSIGLACTLVLAVILAGLVTHGCTAAQQQTAAHVLHMGGDACEAIAIAKGRNDLAALCRATADGAVVLDRATEPVVCGVPDAGAVEAGQ